MMKDSKNYKQKKAGISMDKKGQIAIFVIIALVIISGILVFVLYKPARSLLVPGAKEISPKQYLSDCIEPDLRNAIEILSAQGGYSNPEGYIPYNDKKIKYLCYTSNYYETCTVQQPLIKENFEKELSLILKTNAEKCLAALDSAYKEQGYEVTKGALKINVSIDLGRIRMGFNVPMTITKGETKMTFNSLEAEVKSELYNLLAIAYSIVDYEATYGDSETTNYINYYPDLKINKIKINDGSKIYVLSNVVTDESFAFATRSLVWPAGYGL